MIDLIPAESTEIGETYTDGDNEYYIIAKAVIQSNSDMTGDSDTFLELTKCTDMARLWWMVVETDKSGETVIGREFDNSEEATFFYVERAFGINC